MSLAIAAGPATRQEQSRSCGLDYGKISLERVVDADSLRKTGSKILGWVTGGSEDHAGPLVRPYGISWDDRDLLVADPGAGHIFRISRRGKVSARSDQEITDPIGVAACAIGIVVTESESGRVALLDGDLRFVKWIAQGLERPTGIACDRRRVFVVETGRHRLLAYDSEDAQAPPVAYGRRGDGDGEFNFPVAVALGGEEIWIGDTLNFRVQVLDRKTGQYRRSFGAVGDAPGEMPRTKGIALDSSGHLWVSDAHTDVVAIYSVRGEFLGHLGGPGSDPWQFSFPAGVAAGPDGSMAIVDSFNRRIQVFRMEVDRCEDPTR